MDNRQPPGSGGREVSVATVLLQDRLISPFVAGAGGVACAPGRALFSHDRAWKDNLFSTSTSTGGTGLGASHQTGRTGVVVDAIRRRYSKFSGLGGSALGGQGGNRAGNPGKVISSKQKVLAGLTLASAPRQPREAVP